MIVADKKSNTLFAFQHQSMIPQIPENVVSMEYKSLQRYIKEQLPQDVEELFIPELRKCLKADDLDLILVDTQVVQDDPGHFNDRDWKIKCKFESTNIRCNGEAAPQYFTILAIPYVTEEGQLVHENKNYSYIRMLEQEPAVSYNNDSASKQNLKIKLPKGFLNVAYGSSGPKLQFSDDRTASGLRSYALANVMFAMAQQEGYDADKLWSEFRSYAVTSLFTDEEKLQEAKACLFKSSGTVDGIEYITQACGRLTGTHLKANGVVNKSYDLTEVRDILNDILSLDRAIGSVLAEDVKSVTRPDVTLYHRGDVVTASMLHTCRSNGVYNLFIDNTVNLEGYYLAKYYFVNYIPCGTKITPIIKSFLPEENGMYVSKDYFFEGNEVKVFDDQVKITREIIDILKACGYNSIMASKDRGRAFSTNQKDVYTCHFCEEVLSNRMFPANEVSTSIKSDWVYLDKDNNFVEPSSFFTTYDVAALLSFCTQLFQGKYQNIVINSDIGFRKKFVTLQEQYHRAFEYCVREGFKQMNRSLKEAWNSSTYDFLCNPDFIENRFWAFTRLFFKYLRDEARCINLITSNAICNPLSYLSEMTRVNIFTANKNSVADSQRRIAVGSYGRIDPLETPQSQKMGVVLNTTLGCEYDEDGHIYTCYRELKHLGDRSFVTNNIVRKTVAQEEKCTIADISDIEFNDETGEILNNKKVVLCRMPSSNTLDKHTFGYAPINKVDYVNVHSAQTIGWVSFCAPFLGANDSIRAVFSAAQVKQTKGLLNAEVPRVGTHAILEIPKQNDFYGIIAKDDGVVVRVDYPTTAEAISMELAVKYDTLGEKIYKFDEFSDSGYSVTLRQVEVKEGDKFKKGDTLVSSNWIKDGKLVMGVNAIVAYIPDGYNYEDGVHISESFAEKLSSYRVNKEMFENTFAKKVSKYELSYIRTNRWINPITDTAAAVRVQTKNQPAPTDRKLHTEKADGFLDRAKVVVERKGNTIRYKGVELSLISVDPTQVGDKTVNRHGNKTVTPRCEKNSNMPRLMNGVPIDVAYNPHGVTSRMNDGQILECNLGLAMMVLGWNIITDPYNSITIDEIKMLLKYAYELANSTGDISGICSKYKAIPEAVHIHSKENIESIRVWAGTFDERGEGYLMLPDNFGHLTETKVLWGVNYIEKVVQESDKKIHVRGGAMTGEPYGAISNAPTEGASDHGGQRLGNMELDALCSYGASALIDEFINCRGDNPVARTNLSVNTFLPDELKSEYYLEQRGQRRSTTQFLYTMLALGCIVESDNGEIQPITQNQSDDGYWTVQSLYHAKLNTDDDKSDNDTEPAKRYTTIKPKVESENALLDAARILGGIVTSQ